MYSSSLRWRRRRVQGAAARITASALAIFVSCAAAAQELPDQAPVQQTVNGINFAERSEESQLILELGADDYVLNPGIIVYMDDDDLLIPLRTFVQALEFPITVDHGKGLAEGWFVTEDNRFHLSYPYDTVRLRGAEQSIKGTVETHKDDIYVSKNLITQWFPIDLDLNFNELRLVMKPKVDLPFQARAKRRSQWERMQANRRASGEDLDQEAIELPYHMFAAPAIEVNHSLSLNGTGNDRDFYTNHAVNVQGDLLGMDFRGSGVFRTASNDREELDNVRLTFSREDYRGRLLGGMQATAFSLGDVTGTFFPLAGGGQMGRGVTVRNTPYNFVRDPDNFLVEGYAPAGWDVEIYQDQRLLDFQTVPSDGRYSFETLPLREGFNLFRIVLYGPNGEREERFDRFYLGQNMLDKGQFVYEITAMESSTPLIDVSTNPAPDTDATLSILGDYGLTDNISIAGGYHTGPQGRGKIDGFGTSLRGSGGRVFAQVNGFWNQEGGYSASIDIRGNVTQNLSLSAGHTQHKDYEIGIYSNQEESYIQASQVFDLFSLKSSSITFEARNSKSDIGIKRTDYINRFSTGFAGISLTNQLTYRDYEYADQDDFVGDLTLRARTSFGTLRGRAQYDLQESGEVTSADFHYQLDVTPDFAINSFVTAQLEADKLYTFGAGVDWRRDRYRIGVSGSINDDKDFQIGLTLAYNLVPHDLYGDYVLTGRTDDISTGRLLVQPFIDYNMNGKHDEGEPLVGNVSFKNLLRGTPSTMNDDGLAVVTGISPNLANRIEIESKTLPDIYLHPVAPSISVIGKRGVNGPLDFPLLRLGEINGRLISYDSEGNEVALAETEIILLDPQGREAASSYTEYDGYYNFPSLPLGRYEMYFVQSAALNNFYSGDGEGPIIELTVQQPEIMGLDFVAKDDRIERLIDDQQPDLEAHPIPEIDYQ